MQQNQSKEYKWACWGRESHEGPAMPIDGRLYSSRERALRALVERGRQHPDLMASYVELVISRYEVA